jgi:hypothetical protein
VKMTDNVAVRGIVKASLSDIKQNSFIGVTGMPQADGSQKAVEIHIFPEALRGTGEGHRPWDLMPNSTMTNATVAQMVKGVEGDEITLKYKDGEKKIVVAPNTTIVTYVPGDKSELSRRIRTDWRANDIPFARAISDVSQILICQSDFRRRRQNSQKAPTAKTGSPAPAIGPGAP